ncbi:MAG: hypothetical protein PHT12_04145 [Patescibacteria group bacterium]|nr:hypothetical protein [Patescibacteria group bacterium]
MDDEQEEMLLEDIPDGAVELVVRGGYSQEQLIEEGLNPIRSRTKARRTQLVVIPPELSDEQWEWIFARSYPTSLADLVENTGLSHRVRALASQALKGRFNRPED